MHSIKFKTKHTLVSSFIYLCEDVLIEISRKKDDEYYQVIISSDIEFDEERYLVLMNTFAKIVGEVDSHNIDLIY
jgi:hypothetical protein